MDVMTPQLVLAIIIVEQVYRSFNCDMVITSISDGKHSVGSRHYIGGSFDSRTSNVPERDKAPLTAACKAALGPHYDVILESDHLHVEFDPKFGV